MTNNKINEAYQELGQSLAHVYKGLLLGELAEEDAMLVLGLYIDSVLIHVSVVAQEEKVRAEARFEENEILSNF